MVKYIIYQDPFKDLAEHESFKAGEEPLFDSCLPSPEEHAALFLLRAIVLNSATLGGFLVHRYAAAKSFNLGNKPDTELEKSGMVTSQGHHSRVRRHSG